MKNKQSIIALFALFITCASVNKTIAQTISFSAPSGVTSVASGTILTLTAVGETAQKYIGNVPTYGSINDSPAPTGVTCPLWETNYGFGSTPSTFKYKFINTGTVPITVNFLFINVLIVTKNGSSTSYSNQNISFSITIKPVYDNWITNTDSGIKYGDDWSSTIQWDANLVSTSTVTFEVYQNGVYLATLASNTPNDGSEVMDWTPYATMGVWGDPHWFHRIQLKIISDSNPSIYGMTPQFKMQVD